MIEKLSRNPWLLAAGFVLSALLGAALYALIQSRVPANVRDRAAVEQVVRNYLLEHPEVLPEAMDRLRGRETTKAVNANRAALTRAYAGAQAGNPDGDVTVTVFMDYNCGFCRASLPALAELVRRDPKVRVVYREYPVLGEASVLASRWALAAAEQGKFGPFHDALFAGGQVSQASIDRAAAAAGVDRARAAASMALPAVDGELSGNHQIGAQLGLTGTPAWVVGDAILQGQQSYDELAAAVAKARKG